jgi:tripartite-type tricarboxylate transporter receptor subunit TctC
MGAAGATLGFPAIVHAQDKYPSRPVRVVVPFAPGGGTDTLGRAICQKLTEALGQPFVIDNKPGASGIIGTDAVAKAPPDGYTLSFNISTALLINKFLYTKLPYDPLRDFAPVSLVGRSPLVLTVGENSPLRSLADLTAAAQAAPGKLNYPSSGTGGPNHLGAELYAMQAKVKVSHIPYKGSAPSVVSLVAGETDFGFLTAVTIASQLNAGKVRALAVAHTERLPSMPNVPTMTEAGLKGFTADAWFLAAVPVGTPQPIVDRLYAEIAKALPAPEVKAKLDSVGVLPSGLDPQASAKFLRTEVDKWRGVIKTAGITLD